MPLSASGGFLSNLTRSAQRHLSAERVLVAVTDQAVTCAWLSNGRWVWLSADWPDGACLRGRPQLPEAMADLIADLLLDAGIVGAQIELLLPIDACDWRVLDSFDRKKAALFEPKLPHSLNWRHGVDDSYVSYFDCFGSTMAVGIARLELQAWIDLFEMADLSLHRIDWSLHAAFRGFVGSCPGVDANVAWMIEGPRHHRLLLMRHGVPEVDRSISQLDSEGLLDVVGTIEAWQLLKPTSTPVRWLFTPSLRDSTATDALHDWAQSSLMPIDLPTINLSRWDASPGSELLDPFVSLGFAGLGLLR